MVSEHPYVALTDDKGEFMLKNVPPGTYKVKCWHEGWKQMSEKGIGRIELQAMGDMRTVTVKAGETVNVDFAGLAELKPPAKPKEPAAGPP